MDAERVPRLLLVGGAGGFVGRHVLPAFSQDYRIRSIHRHPVFNESGIVEWIPADVSSIIDWAPILEGVDVVLNLAWYRWGRAAAFQRLYDGLRALVQVAARAGVRRFLHVSVPPAPAELEAALPYLVYKRRLDHDLEASGLSYRIVRPTLLFGTDDKLLSVMMRLIHRYPFFPMFGDGGFRVSPVAVRDLARILRAEAGTADEGTLTIGGPETFRYRDLTDLMFRYLGKRPRYWQLTRAGAVRLVRLMAFFRSKLLYPYEVEWLTSDLLALPAFDRLNPPLERVGPFLEREAARWRAARPGRLSVATR